MTIKLVLAVLAVMIVAATLWADYKWRRWIAARRRERDAEERDVN